MTGPRGIARGPVITPGIALGRPGLRVFFIHGAGAQNTDDSSQPLLRGLRGALPRETVVDAPIMPDPDHPDAVAWGRAVRKHMAGRRLEIVADLKLGTGTGAILTNDLTHAYVDENMGTS